MRILTSLVDTVVEDTVAVEDIVDIVVEDTVAVESMAVMVVDSIATE